jgi:hypothetical protein
MMVLVKKVGLILLLLIYVYSIVLDFVPISTKILLEGLGLCLCLPKILSNKYRLKREYKYILQLFFLMILWDVITSIFNGQSEFHIIFDIVPIIGSFFGAELIYKCFKNVYSDNKYFYRILVLTIFIESVIAVLMSLIPSLYTLFDSFLVFNFGDDRLTSAEDLSRFVGLGYAIYFGVLPSCCLGVMTSVYVISIAENNKLKIFFILAWILIAMVSFLTARTSLALFAISFLYFIYCQKSRGLLKVIGSILALLIIVFLVVRFILSNADDRLLRWAFSFLIDPESDDGTLGYLQDWYTNTTFDLKTLIIGDARWVDPVWGYYMRVDVGYFRQIYYGGILYLFMTIFSHWKVIKMSIANYTDGYYRYLLYSMMLGFLCILGKGDASMLSFFILFLVIQTKGIFEPIKKYQ